MLNLIKKTKTLFIDFCVKFQLIKRNEAVVSKPCYPVSDALWLGFNQITWFGAFDRIRSGFS
ncbi:hypothetical protein CLOSTMETH_02714 [[Clostridium] methylpentosum DSM 5476]|uniref:Uncharacterized protein n=1 Tax=[Clostridium] methylpentosum DSM 5476 TaxID=537013 RepID=C0EFS2_9FIRM|nr:hypothetical protein CLOSTMETH_02714 [[Clostridium] methylpentosum DSM 5476]